MLRHSAFTLLVSLLAAATCFVDPYVHGDTRPPQPPSPYTQDIGDTGLPNDCTIIATIAFLKVGPSVFWRNLLCFHLDITIGDKTEHAGHTVFVWKLSNKGHVLVYDSEGTMEMDTASTEAKDIATALQSRLKKNFKITDYQFVE